MKTFLLGMIGLVALGAVANADSLAALSAGERGHLTSHALWTLVDWQDPRGLPPRFRNHCGLDARFGRYYCSNHCGTGYEFYYCSNVSFGCCAVGFGYCDRHGHLRCHP